MAYVEPNSTVKLLSNVPLLPNYQDTIYFTTEAEQYAYFDRLSKYNCQKQSYQRVNRGVFKFGIPTVNKFYNINYMMFKNTNFENKWFYAFVTKVEYINNNCVEVSFEIDVMQTYFFDYELQACFVEREHTSTDSIGGSLTSEPFDDLGEYVCNYFNNIDLGDPYVFVLSAPKDYSKLADTSTTYANYYCGCISGVAGRADDPETVGKYLDSWVSQGKEDAVLQVTEFPEFMYKSISASTRNSPLAEKPNITYYGTLYTKSIDGYKPKNNKLFNYPYNYILLSDMRGHQKVYHYEHFDTMPDGYFSLTAFGTVCPNTQITIVPNDYKGMDTNWEEGLTCTDYPYCAFIGDNSSKYLANELPSMAIKGIGSVATGGIMGSAVMPGVGTAAGAAIGAGVAGISLVMSMLSGAVKSATTPDEMHGSLKSGSSGNSFGVFKFNFRLSYMTIDNKIAKIIDDFFTMYGYTCGEIKVPNRNVRPYWTYTKTSNCKIIPNCPSDDAQKICDIYNNGITFWQPNATVGDYISQDNSVN